MKTIGMIGGMSWESSLEYYRIINEKVKEELGGFHSARSILYSVDFNEIEKLQHQNRWHELTDIMIDAAVKLEKSGADIIMICTNTMHKMAEEVQNSINVPFIHIADATGETIQNAGLKKTGLLGTKFTMEQDFYKKRLSEKYGIDVIIPDPDDREIVHNTIYNELCVGKIMNSSKQKLLNIIDKLIQNGAQGIILGCTEIPLLIKQPDVSVPVFNTMQIHAEYAVMEAVK